MLDDYNREKIHSRWNIKILFIYIKNGVRNIFHSRGRLTTALVFVGVLISIALVLLCFRPDFKSFFPRLNKSADVAYTVLVCVYAALAGMPFLFLMGKPRGAKRMNDNFKRAGMINHTGEAPLLLSKKSLPDNDRVREYELYSAGIPFDLWQEKLQDIESALNLKISRFEEGRNSSVILMYAVNGNYSLPQKISWQDKYLIDNENGFALVLGESITGEKVTVNLKTIPHLLIGGSTGSGKSVLLKLLLYQAAQKGAKVIISDFKGGVDFPPVWHSKCVFITEMPQLCKALSEVVDELNSRKVVLRQSGLPNIDEYNESSGKSPERIVFACDEIAEVLDKTGLSKEAKSEVAEVEGLISTIARQGRAFGIHLFLATQRPDANILSGQIKNNIDYRVCGRSDQVLSMIVLDKPDASERISKTAQGRFLDNSDTLFQAYYFKEWR